MATIDAQYLRQLANLPQAIPDTLLLPHIDGADREVQARIGPTADTPARKEAVGCFAMAYALPVLETFYVAGAAHVPRSVADTNYTFHDAADIQRLVRLWEERALRALASIPSDAGGATGVTAQVI